MRTLSCRHILVLKTGNNNYRKKLNDEKMRSFYGTNGPLFTLSVCNPLFDMFMSYFFIL